MDNLRFTKRQNGRRGGELERERGGGAGGGRGGGRKRSRERGSTTIVLTSARKGGGAMVAVSPDDTTTTFRSSLFSCSWSRGHRKKGSIGGKNIVVAGDLAEIRYRQGLARRRHRRSIIIPSSSVPSQLVQPPFLSLLVRPVTRISISSFSSRRGQARD